jgi:hypothetical protein
MELAENNTVADNKDFLMPTPKVFFLIHVQKKLF